MNRSDFESSVSGLQHSPGFGRDLAAVLAVGLVVVVVLVLWAKYLRTTRRRRSRSADSSSKVGSSVTLRKNESDSGSRERRRREHRPRNPTLAEKGGLPPVRTDVTPRETQ